MFPFGALGITSRARSVWITMSAEDPDVWDTCFLIEFCSGVWCIPNAIGWCVNQSNTLTSCFRRKCQHMESNPSSCGVPYAPGVHLYHVGLIYDLLVVSVAGLSTGWSESDDGAITGVTWLFQWKTANLCESCSRILLALSLPHAAVIVFWGKMWPSVSPVSSDGEGVIKYLPP